MPCPLSALGLAWLLLSLKQLIFTMLCYMLHATCTCNIMPDHHSAFWRPWKWTIFGASKQGLKRGPECTLFAPTVGPELGQAWAFPSNPWCHQGFSEQPLVSRRLCPATLGFTRAKVRRGVLKRPSTYVTWLKRGVDVQEPRATRARES